MVKGFSSALRAGGNWDNGSYCGSRSRNGNNPRSNANDNNGGRGAIRRFKQKKIC